MPAIVVLIKHVPDSWSPKQLKDDFTLDRQNVDSVIDEVDEYAVEQALRLKEETEGFRVVAATMGPPAADEALRKALSMGADDAVRLSDESLAGSDALGTAYALSQLVRQIEDVALVVTGASSSDGETGLVTGMLAEYLQYPALSAVSSASFDGSTVTAKRIDGRGTFELSAPTPAVISVTERADKPRFPNFKKMRAAKSYEITEYDLSAIGVQPGQVGLANSLTQVTTANATPPRVAGEIIYAKDPKETATQIADYLAQRGLI